MASILAQTETVLNASGTDNIREDLGNVIFNVTPFKTPFFSAIAKSKATNDRHEWMTDTLRASSATNFVLESALFASEAPGTRIRKGNQMGISQEQATVTLKAELMDKAGIPGTEMSYQLMKKGKELQMDVETSMLAINASVPATNSTPGEPGSVAAFIVSNDQVAGDGTANPSALDSTVPVAGSNRTFTEAFFVDAIDSIWDASGDLDGHTVQASAGVVATIRTFSGLVDSQDAAASEGTIWNRITVYQSQFGPLKVVPNKQCLANTCYILDPSTWAIAFGGGKAIHTTDIATLTAAKSKLMEMYWTLEARSEEANAAIYALT